MRKKTLKWFFLFLVFLVSCWGAGFAFFSYHVYTMKIPDKIPTDGIVVFTGALGRIPVGVSLLRQRLAKKLLISGVSAGNDIKCCDGFLTLGYQAKDTCGNAQETALWMKENHFSSLRVVTCDYHMPRSLLELKKKLPLVQLISHPVKTSKNIYKIFKEYNKFILTYLKNILF